MLQISSKLSGNARSLALVTCALVIAPLGHASIIELRPTADNTLYEDSLGNFSNALGESFFAGKTQTELLRRGLLRFDFSAIPSGAVIDSVTLTLHCTRSISLAEPVSLHRGLAGWGEGTSNALGSGGGGTQATLGDATWLHQSLGGMLWTTPGGDFTSLASATIDVSGIGAYVWSSSGMRDDVQTWLANSASNHGWTVLGNEQLIGSAKRFASRENLNADLRPLLTVAYTIPTPGYGYIIIAACGALRRRRN